MGAVLRQRWGRDVSIYLTAREAAERLAGPIPDNPDKWQGRELLQRAHADARLTLTGRPSRSGGKPGDRAPLPRGYFEDGGLDLGDNSAGPDAQGKFRRLEDGLGLTQWADVRVSEADVEREAASLGGPGHESWRIGLDEKQKSWANRPEVEAEAARRLASGDSSKRSVNGVLTEMAAECGRKWKQPSLSEARRRHERALGL